MRTLEGKNSHDDLEENQVRQLRFDTENIYSDFKRILSLK